MSTISQARIEALDDGPSQEVQDKDRAIMRGKAALYRETCEARAHTGKGTIRRIYANRLADVIAAIEIAAKVHEKIGDLEGEMGVMGLLMDAKNLHQKAAASAA